MWYPGYRAHVDANDDTAGLYGPDSEAWALDREAMLLLGAGPRALLLQIAHPAVAAGVDEHSDFRADPWRRLAGTLKSYLTIVYGSTAVARRRDPAAQPAAHRHRRGGLQRPAILSCRCGSTPRSWIRRSSPTSAGSRRSTPARRELAYLETRPIGRAFGIPDSLLPKDLAAFDAYIAGMLSPDGPVHPGSRARELAAVILHPPLGPLLPRRRAVPVAGPAGGLQLDALAVARPASARVREAYGFSWGVRERAVSAWLVAGWRAWRPLIPRQWRQMPKALAADDRMARAPGGVTAVAGNLERNIVERRSRGVAASSASSKLTVPASP